MFSRTQTTPSTSSFSARIERLRTALQSADAVVIGLLFRSRVISLFSSANRCETPIREPISSILFTLFAVLVTAFLI